MQLLEIENLLMETIELSKSFKNKELKFASHVVQWLERFEEVLKNNKMSESGILAAKKAMILAADRGCIPEHLSIKGRETKMKWKNAAAIHALQFVTNLVEKSIEQDKRRREDAVEVALKIAAHAELKRLPGFGELHSMVSDEDRWSIIMQDPDVRGGALQLQGLMGKIDSIVLLANYSK